MGHSEVKVYKIKIMQCAILREREGEAHMTIELRNMISMVVRGVLVKLERSSWPI
jgi:hypothetical protein